MKQSRFLLIILLASLTACFSGNKTVETSYGSLEGQSENGVMRFLGVPYAQPPLGHLRWQKPQALQAWEGKKRAVLPKSACVQGGIPTGALGSSEDCLYLNVWAPAKPGKYPVMLWLHGGGFLLGSGNEPHYDGANLARTEQVVVVSANYRLSYLGHFALPEALTTAAGLEPMKGNQAFYDQLAALHWIKKEITAFHGDADNITVFGESAGAISACVLLASPLTQGLIHKVIMQSGSCSTFEVVHYSQLEQQGLDVIEQFACADSPQPLLCAQAVSGDKMMKIMQPQAMELFSKPPEQWTYYPKVVYGDEILPKHPLQLLADINKPVEVLLGSNKDEGSLFVFARDYPATQNGYEQLLQQTYAEAAPELARLYPLTDYATTGDAMSAIAGDSVIGCSVQAGADILSRQGIPVYRYTFEQPVESLSSSMFSLLIGKNSISSFGSFHAAEIPYVFAQPGPLGGFPTKQHQQMSDIVQRYWGQFAHHGNPNDGEQMFWPAYMEADGQYLVLGPAMQLKSHYRKRYCDFWVPRVHSTPAP